MSCPKPLIPAVSVAQRALRWTCDEAWVATHRAAEIVRYRKPANGTCRTSRGRLQNAMGYSRRVLDRGAAREVPWGISHPVCWRRWLMGYVRPEAWIDPETGRPWHRPDDLALYLPMLAWGWLTRWTEGMTHGPDR
jgi:hypothetical protein